MQISGLINKYIDIFSKSSIRLADKHFIEIRTNYLVTKKCKQQSNQIKLLLHFR